MTADEFHKILERFRKGLDTAGQWAIETNYRDAPEPEWVGVLDQVWRDLSRECAMMKDAERQRPGYNQPDPTTLKSAAAITRSRVLRNSSIPVNP